MTQDERTPDTQVLIERANRAIDTCCALGCSDCDLIRDLRDALAAQKDARVISLLEAIADPRNDPNDFAADAVLVIHVWQREAQDILALAKPESVTEKP
jgi:hypothetical protein